MSLIDDISNAIARMEGFNVSGSIAARNNNPGNLRSGPGQVGSNGGFAVFPDLATGWNALNNQVQLNINKGLTLNEFFGGKPGVYAGYAPQADNNNPNQYAQFVASQTGLDPNTPIVNGNSFGVSGSVVDTTGYTFSDSVPVADTTSSVSGYLSDVSGISLGDTLGISSDNLMLVGLFGIAIVIYLIKR